MAAIRLKLDDADLEAFELLLDRLAQGLRHMKWAVAEHRKAMAAGFASEAMPIPREDLTL